MTKNKIKKAWYKRWWAITLYVFVGLIILAGLFGENPPSSNPNTNTRSDSQPEIAVSQEKVKTSTNSNTNTNTRIGMPQPITAEPEKVKTYSVGDSIQAGDFKWKIIRSSTAAEIGEDIMGTFLGEKADGIFIILEVEVENTGRSAQLLMDSYLKLVDEQGREFSPNSVAAIYLKPEGSALMFAQINPGITKKGKIVFDVPENLKVASVRISSNLLESSFYNVRLII